VNASVQMVEKRVMFDCAYCDEDGVLLYWYTFTCHQITDKKTFCSIHQHQRGSRVRNSEDNPGAEVGSHCAASRVQHMEVGHSCRTSQILSHLVAPVWTASLFL